LPFDLKTYQHKNPQFPTAIPNKKSYGNPYQYSNTPNFRQLPVPEKTGSKPAIRKTKKQ